VRHHTAGGRRNRHDRTIPDPTRHRDAARSGGRSAIGDVVIVGGRAAISDRVVNQLFRELGR
jgi:hypothetical protein